MPKRRKKTDRCLNCGLKLTTAHNFCPNCGQENDDRNVSFWRLVVDFFSNYFSLDSKFGRSIVPLFFRPGYLTKRFHEGKRAGYANPIRLYLLVSILYFFAVSSAANHQFGDKDENVVIFGGSSRKKKDKPAQLLLPDSTRLSTADQEALERAKAISGMLKQYVPDAQDQFNRLNDVIDSLQQASQAYNDSVAAAKSRKPTTAPDSTAQTTPTDSTATQKYYNGAGQNQPKNEDDGEGSFAGMSEQKWDQFQYMFSNDELTYAQIEDSLRLNEEGFWAQLLAKQVYKVNKEDKGFLGYIISNIPIMMFVLLPVFAFILKILYIRRKWLYIKHLVHALHLHIFAYLIYGTTLLININLVHADHRPTVGFISFVLVSTYAYISFLRVYLQGWFKTLVKFNMVGFTYFITLFTAILAEIMISFLLF